jgi:hypothetical protein
MTLRSRFKALGSRKLAAGSAAVLAAGLGIGLTAAPSSASTVTATGRMYNDALSPRCLGNTGSSVYTTLNCSDNHTLWKFWNNGSLGIGFQNVATGLCLNVIPGAPATVNAIACDANDALQEWTSIPSHDWFTYKNRGTAQPKCLNANGAGGGVNAILCDGNDNYQIWTAP